MNNLPPAILLALIMLFSCNGKYRSDAQEVTVGEVLASTGSRIGDTLIYDVHVLPRSALQHSKLGEVPDDLSLRRPRDTRKRG